MNRLRLIFWELTKRCNLKCKHCRAEAGDDIAEGELNSDDIESLIDNIVSFSSPILVLTGGEPLYRNDIFQIAEYAKAKGLRIALATNGTLINRDIASRIRSAGFDRVSISIDGENASSHDEFRGIKGAFDDALRGAKFIREAGVDFQFNTTVTRRNVGEIEGIINLSLDQGAKALHIFMLVPVGCGVEIAETDMLPKDRIEEILRWLYDRTKEVNLEIRATCAPHYHRIIRQRAREEGRKISFETDGMSAMTRGCLAGTGVCFISHRGDVQPCGYLPLIAGNVRDTGFHEIWEQSSIFLKLRDLGSLKGKCGICEYRSFCAGCRARAYYDTGDYLAEEPYCVYIPKRIYDEPDKK